MAVFIELVTDAFENVFQEQVSSRQGASETRSSRAGRPLARRPVRGIEIKEDTYAYLRVILPNSKSLPLLDSSSPDGQNTSGYTNFILQSVQEERMEKHQIVETFGDAYIFFFGESPRFLNVSAILVNTHDFNWLAEWWHNYENYLRGTKLVELGARCYLFYDDNVIEGYILGAQASTLAEQPYQVSLNFRFFITKYRNVSLHNVEYFPLRSSAHIVEAPELTNADAFTQAAAAYRGSLLGPALVNARDRQSQVVQDAFGNPISEVPLPQKQKISDIIRKDPAISFDPDIWTQLVGVSGLVDPDNPNSPVSLSPVTPAVRGLIAENVDEYVMGGDGNNSLANELARLGRRLTARQQAAQAAIDAENLTQLIVYYLALIGINADNVETVRGLGLGPNFRPGFSCGQGGSLYTGSAGVVGGASASAAASGGASFTASASASAGASFSPFADFSASAGASASASYKFGASASARAGSYANAQVSSSALPSYGASSSAYASAYASYSSDPLAAVYGRGSVSASFGPDREKFFEGAGDAEYGYHSAFGGAGYGQAGFGDLGGNGFGGALSTGDPGFRASASFSFSGVGSASAAFSKFTSPRNDKTALTGGCVLGGSSLNGRGSVSVGGSSSAFALVSAEGSIQPWASAQVQANGFLSFGAQATASAYATAGIGL